MTEFIQIHALTAYLPSNLNRDDPVAQTAIIGGAARGSSRIERRGGSTFQEFSGHTGSGRRPRLEGGGGPDLRPDAAGGAGGRPKPVRPKIGWPTAVDGRHIAGAVWDQEGCSTGAAVLSGPEDPGIDACWRPRRQRVAPDPAMLNLLRKEPTADIAMFG